MNKLIWNIQYCFWLTYYRIKRKLPSKDRITIEIDYPPFTPNKESEVNADEYI